MGNTTSLEPEDSGALDFDGLPTLDALGGINRPAVSRSNQLDTKLNWLGANLHETANSIESVLQKDPGKARLAMNELGGSHVLRPRNRTIQVFGRTTQMADNHQSAYTGDSSLRRSLPFTLWQPPPSPGRAQLRPCSSDNSSHKQVRTSTGVREAEHMLQTEQRTRRLSLIMPTGTFPMAVPIQQPQTGIGSMGANPLRSSTPLLPSRRRASTDGIGRMDSSSSKDRDEGLLFNYDRSSPPQPRLSPQYYYTRMQPTPPVAPRGLVTHRTSSSSGGGGSIFSTAAASVHGSNGGITASPRRKIRALVASALPMAEEISWRKRVQDTKRRLYWYLKAYMAFVSILRRKRSGYADEMPLDVLPVFLANGLGSQCLVFGDLLLSTAQLATEAHAKNARISALRSSRRYLSGVKAKVQSSHNKEERAPSWPEALPFPPVDAAGSGEGGIEAGAVLPLVPLSPSHAPALPKEPSMEFTATAPEPQGTPQRLMFANAEPLPQETLKAQEAEMLGIVNRANSAWVEARGSWHSPQVLDMISVASHQELYRRVATSLLESGKIAVNLVYIGEEQSTGIDKNGNELLQPLLTLDLWEALGKLFPHKVPRGQRILGVSLLSRRIMQIIVDIERAVGASALEKLTLLLSIDSMYVDWVLAELLLYRHYCLNPEQIIIVSIARFPGCIYDDMHHVFALNYDATAREPGGSGYPLLAMAWASSTFWLDSMGERQYLSGSCLGWLARNNVEWIHSSMVIDFEQLSPSVSSVTDITFMAPAVFAFDHKGAGMAMEVCRAPTDAMVRRLCNLVLSPDPMEPYACAISTQDMQSTFTRTILSSLEREAASTAYKNGTYVSCNHRYLYNVQHLTRILCGPVIFHPDVSYLNGHAYLTLEQTDITSIHVRDGTLQSKCVSVLGKHRGPDMRTQVHSREWLREFGATLMAQDSQEAFRTLVSRASIRSAVSNSPTVTANVAHPQDKGIKIVLYLTDSYIANRCAFRMVRALMRSAADTLSLVYVVGSLSGTTTVSPELEKTMGSFHDVLLDSQITRRTIGRSDKVVQAILDDIVALSPDLVALGSEKLSQTAAGTSPAAAGVAAMSVALAVARGVRDVPVLVVKTGGAGKLLQASEVPGVVPPVRVLLEACTAGATAAAFIFARLHTAYGRMTPNGEDKVFIARPFGLDKTNKQTHHSSRLISSLARSAAHLRIVSEPRPIATGALEGFPHLIAQDNIDMLVLSAPSSCSLPTSIVDIVKIARCAVLVYRMRSTLGL